METSPTVPVRRKRLRFWLLLVGSLIVVVGSVLAVVSGFFRQDRIGPANYEKIQIGMKVQDVENLLGKLDDDGRCYDGTTEEELEEGFDGWVSVAEEGNFLPFREIRENAWWIGRRGFAIGVVVDPATHRICWKEIKSLHKPDIWERIKSTLHLGNVF